MPLPKNDIIFVLLNKRVTKEFLKRRQKCSVKLAKSLSGHFKADLPTLGNATLRKIPVLIETRFGPKTDSKWEYHDEGGFATISCNTLMNEDSGAHVLVPNNELVNPNVKHKEKNYWMHGVNLVNLVPNAALVEDRCSRLASKCGFKGRKFGFKGRKFGN